MPNFCRSSRPIVGGSGRHRVSLISRLIVRKCVFVFHNENYSYPKNIWVTSRGLIRLKK